MTLRGELSPVDGKTLFSVVADKIIEMNPGSARKSFGLTGMFGLALEASGPDSAEMTGTAVLAAEFLRLAAPLGEMFDNTCDWDGYDVRFHVPSDDRLCFDALLDIGELDLCVMLTSRSPPEAFDSIRDVVFSQWRRARFFFSPPAERDGRSVRVTARDVFDSRGSLLSYREAMVIAEAAHAPAQAERVKHGRI